MTREEFLAQEIETYRKKIDTFQAMIAEWEKELGHTSTSSSNSGTLEPSGGKKTPTSGDPLSMIHGMVFFGKSQPDAAKAFLEMVHYPLTTQQILDGIEKTLLPEPPYERQTLGGIVTNAFMYGTSKIDDGAVGAQLSIWQPIVVQTGA